MANARKLAEIASKAYPDDTSIATATGQLDALAILGAKDEDRFGAVIYFDDSVANSERARQARREIEHEDTVAQAR